MKKIGLFILALILSIVAASTLLFPPFALHSSNAQSSPNVSSPEGQVKLQTTPVDQCPEECPPKNITYDEGCYKAECINGRCVVTLLPGTPKWQQVHSCLERAQYCKDGKLVTEERPRGEGVQCADEMVGICRRDNFICKNGICAPTTSFFPDKPCGTPRAEVCREITSQCTGYGACAEKTTLLPAGTSCGSTREKGCRTLISECTENGECAERSTVNPGISCGTRQEEECRVIEPYCDEDGTCKNKETALENKPCGKTELCWSTNSVCTAQGLCKEGAKTYFPGKSCGERTVGLCEAREPVCGPTGECEQKVTYSPTGTDCSRDKPLNKCKNWTCDGVGGCKEEIIRPCCGNGIVEPPEQCDHGGTPSSTCSESCTKPEGPGGACPQLGDNADWTAKCSGPDIVVNCPRNGTEPMYYPVLPECAPRLQSPCQLQSPNAWPDTLYLPPCGPRPPLLPRGCYRTEAITGEFCIPNKCPGATLLLIACQPAGNGQQFYECPIEECVKDDCCPAGDEKCQERCRSKYAIAVDCPTCPGSECEPGEILCNEERCCPEGSQCLVDPETNESKCLECCNSDDSSCFEKCPDCNLCPKVTVGPR